MNVRSPPREQWRGMGAVVELSQKKWGRFEKLPSPADNEVFLSLFLGHRLGEADFHLLAVNGTYLFARLWRPPLGTVHTHEQHLFGSNHFVQVDAQLLVVVLVGNLLSYV